MNKSTAYLNMEEVNANLKAKLDEMDPCDPEYQKVYDMYNANIKNIIDAEKNKVDIEKAKIAQETEVIKTNSNKALKIFEAAIGVIIGSVIPLVAKVLMYREEREDIYRYTDYEMNGHVTTSQTLRDLKRDHVRR